MKKLSICCILGGSIVLSGCVPAVIGGAGAVGVAATKEKGITGAMNDTKISSAIKLGLYQKDPDLHRLVDVNVQNGEVMLTGAVPTEEMRLDAVKIAWKPQGVVRVINNISQSEGASFGTYANDTMITTHIKSSLMFDDKVQLRNYSVKTVSGQVYLMGIAQDQAELDRAVNHARNATGVVKVVSYVQIKDKNAEEDAGEDAKAETEAEATADTEVAAE